MKIYYAAMLLVLVFACVPALEHKLRKIPAGTTAGHLLRKDAIRLAVSSTTGLAIFFLGTGLWYLM